MSKLQVDDIVNKEDNGSVGFSRGAVVTGVITATSFSGTLTGGASGDFSIADKIIHTGDTDTAIRFPTNDTVTVETASTERFRITSAGKVGIGTASPRRLLHLNGGSETVKIQITNTGTGSGTDGDGFQLGIAADGTAAVEQRENKSLNFYTNNTERFRIDSSGRLLIGTSTSRSIGAGSGYPGKLQVESTGFTNTTFTQNSNDIYGPEVNLGKSRGTSSGGTTVVQSGDQLGIIQFAGADGTDLETNAAAIECKVDGTPGSNDMPGRLTFSTTADGASSTTERLRITSEGLVQIATSTTSSFPDRLLSVGDISRASSYIDIRSSTVGGLLFADGTSGDAAYRGQVAYNHSDDAMQFWTSATEQMRINSAGDVLMGGTNDATADFVFQKGARASFYRNLYFGGASSALANSQINANGTATFNGAVKIGGNAAANQIDEYEEGTWTPTAGSGLSINSGSWAATGRYVKIGRQVTVEFVQTSGTVSFSAGGLILSGLPFNASTGGNGSVGAITNDTPNISVITLIWTVNRIYAASAASSQTGLRFAATYQTDE